MATASGDPIPRPSWPARLLTSGFGTLVAIAAALWAVEIADSVLLGDRLQDNGIHPRDLDGLDGIAWAPFLHSTFGHLASNTVPFLALGFLVVLRGVRHWLMVTLVVIVGGGLATWLIGGSGNHIGASGVVFGYFGALLGAAIYERRPRTIAPALVALLLYSGMVAGLVPRAGISWEGHLFGLIFGFLAARHLARRQRARRTPATLPASDDEAKYPWELDEPWLEP